jgi:hypothetical protein
LLQDELKKAVEADARISGAAVTRKTQTPQPKQCYFQTIVRYALSGGQLVRLDLLINGLFLRNKCLGWYVLPRYFEDDLYPSRN